MPQHESPLKFPCSFPIKAMGKNTPEFEIAVLSIIRRHCSNLREDAIQTRTSRAGTYLAVTVTIEAHSKQQLDDIYRELSAHELVSMAL